MSKRRIFRDPAHDRTFENDGYVILDILAPDAIKDIEQFFVSNSDQEFTGWHNSLELDAPEQKSKIFEFLKDVYNERIVEYVADYRPLIGAFVSKKSDANSLVRLHQDWTFVDETLYPSLNLWFPLCSTNSTNGALTVLKGSHTIKRNIRGSGIPPRIKISADLAEKYSTSLPMKPGSVLFYDHRLIHGSGANRSGIPRTAASIGLIPAEATALHYVATDGGAVEIEVDEAFFHNLHLTSLSEAKGSYRYDHSGVGYRSRTIEFAETSIEDHDIIRRYERKTISAFRSLKTRFKPNVRFD